MLIVLLVLIPFALLALEKMEDVEELELDEQLTSVGKFVTPAVAHSCCA